MPFFATFLPRLFFLLIILILFFTKKNRETINVTFMKYECPSCYLAWEDKEFPLDNTCHPLCSFCSGSHTQKELLDWQINHIENINIQRFPKLLRHLYRFFELELNLLREKFDETENKKTEKDG